MSEGAAGFDHHPVMSAEVVSMFSTVPAGVVVDATVGAGGHAKALLETYDHIRVVGIDRDERALRAAAQNLSGFGSRVQLHHMRFDGIAGLLGRSGLSDGGPVDALSGVLFDLGVSSPQLDDPARGFSYRHDAPLDMRMDPSGGMTAADVVNTYDEARLARLLADNADERFARRIARAIVAARPLATTTELVEVVRDAIPAPARRGGGHPAKRTFQALRMEVNSELEVLAAALDSAIAALCRGGRCVVLSYHSGEDRLVKQRFVRGATGGCTCPSGLPCVCGAVPELRLVRRGAMKPTAEELASNPRARSARLRVAEKLEGGAAR